MWWLPSDSLSESTPSCSVPIWASSKGPPDSGYVWLRGTSQKYEEQEDSEVEVFITWLHKSGLLQAGFVPWPKVMVLSDSPLHIPLAFFLSIPVATTALRPFRSRGALPLLLCSWRVLCGFSTPLSVLLKMGPWLNFTHLTRFKCDICFLSKPTWYFKYMHVNIFMSYVEPTLQMSSEPVFWSKCEKRYF